MCLNTVVAVRALATEASGEHSHDSYSRKNNERVDHALFDDVAWKLKAIASLWVCARVAEMLGAPIAEEVHNHHNYAWREEHNGEQLWVVRKGATPAFPGQRGFVGGTMGEQSVILEGVENEYATVPGDANPPVWTPQYRQHLNLGIFQLKGADRFRR